MRLPRNGPSMHGDRRSPGVRHRRGSGCGRSSALLAVLPLWLALAGCTPREQGLALERRELALERLGAEIVRRAPGASVLVVGNPFARAGGAEAGLRRAEDASVRGLRRGLGTAATLVGVAVPELRPGALEDPRSFLIPSGATTPLSFLTVPGAWDRLLAAHPSTGVVVSLIGLPADVGTTRAWVEPGGPAWVLYLPDLRLLGSITAVEAAFADGKLLAFVVPRPGAPAESERMARDGGDEFQRRYLLFTRDNVAELRGRWPELVPAR